MRGGRRGEDVPAGAPAGIDQPGGLQALRRGAVARESLALGNHRPVPGEAEPGQILKEGRHILRAAAVAIEIVVAQEEAASGAAGPGGRGPKRARMAQMEVAGGRGGEAAAVGEGRDHEKYFGTRRFSGFSVPDNKR